MAKFNDDWKVQAHGPVETLDEGLVTVAGEIHMPLGHFPRRMTVVALSGGRAAVWSPVPVREPEMEEIEALGAIAFLIVPGIGHRLDIRAWKARYPEAKVVCAPGAREMVEEAAPVDAVGDVLDDPAVRLVVPPGVQEREAVLLIRRGPRTTLVLNDMLANVHHPHGLGAKVMATLLGFGVHEPEMPKIGKKLFLDDAHALAGAFREWAAEPGLVRIVVSHGEVITDDPRGVLEKVADDLQAE
jgi:hypothetical protein